MNESRLFGEVRIINSRSKERNYLNTVDQSILNENVMLHRYSDPRKH